MTQLIIYSILFSISITEILQKDILKDWKAKTIQKSYKYPKIIQNIIEEWLICQICGTSQTMYCCTIVCLFFDFNAGIWVFLLANPVGLLTKKLFY